MRASNATNTLHKDAQNLLKEEIEKSFESDMGPGALPLKNFNEPIKGAIVPSDAYALAGPAMAWAYYSISGLEMPDVFVIFGKNYGSGKTVTSLSTIETPYGLVRVDQPFARALSEKGNVEIKDSDFENQKHIDAQLPFLQYGKFSELEKIKIVPLLVGDDVDIAELSTDIKETLADQGKKAFYICATNMTRYGSKFKYVPFTEKIKDTIYESAGL
jgi:AmmeMemoRadiSam system protein B